MQDTVTDVLKKIIAKQAHLDPAAITADSVLADLGVTSLDLVEIIMSIEDAYDVTIEVDAVAASNNYKTVGDLVALGQSLGLDGPRDAP